MRGAGREKRLVTWTDKKIEAAFLLSVLGATENDMATAFEVPVSTIKWWKRARPEFKKAVDDGTLGLISGVANSLARRALGYTYDEEVVTWDRSSKCWQRTTRKVEVPPDAWAAARILELKARNFNWSVTQQIQISNINTNIDINYNELTTEQLLVLKEISQKGLPQNAGADNS
jgi:hypothetical protein